MELLFPAMNALDELSNSLCDQIADIIVEKDYGESSFHSCSLATRILISIVFVLITWIFIAYLMFCYLQSRKDLLDTWFLKLEMYFWPGDFIRAAALNGDGAELTWLLCSSSARRQIDSTDTNRWTALHQAAYRGNKECVEILLRNGANVTLRDSHGGCPVIVACLGGHLECVRLLLSAGGRTDVRERLGRTALLLAIRRGRLDIIAALLDHGADPDTRSTEGWTPLTAAAALGLGDCIHLLMTHTTRRADLNATGPLGRTALMTACAQGNVSCVLVLLHFGAAMGLMDPDNNTALTLAIAGGHAACAESLLTHQPEDVTAPELEQTGYHVQTSNPFQRLDVNAQEAQLGHSALVLAAGRGLTRCVELLLSAGADVHAIERKGRTALMLGVDSPTCVKLLLGAGSNLECRDQRLSTATMYAAANGSKHSLTQFLDAGARVGDKDDQGRSALVLACAQGHTGCVQMLIEAGAILDDKDNKGRTALMLACAGGHAECAAALLSGGANPGIVETSAGLTALLIACVCDYDTCAQVLLQAGASANQCDAQGRSPLYVASQLSRDFHKGYKDVNNSNCCRLLVSHGAVMYPQRRSGEAESIQLVGPYNSTLSSPELMAAKGRANSWSLPEIVGGALKIFS